VSLPPWKSHDPVEQEAFMRWAVAALDQLDHEQLTAPSHPANVALFLDFVAAGNAARAKEAADFEQVRATLPHLTLEEFRRGRDGPRPVLPQAPAKPGTKAIDPALKRSRTVELAAADNERLTELFARHYPGKKNRVTRPSREAIIRERWLTYTPDSAYPMTDEEWQQIFNIINLPKAKRTPRLDR
jgi:hypothetical protein